MSEAKRGAGRSARDAEATRRDILLAARALFSQDSYERVTIRKIAARAGIDAALVIRYFGSKEALFLAALTSVGVCPSSVFEGEMAALGERLLRSQVPQWDQNDPNDPMLIIMRSASNADAASSLRKLLNDDIVQPIAAKLEGPNRQVRAELALAQLIGIAVVRNLIRSEALSALPVHELADIAGPAFRHYLQSGEAEPAEGKRSAPSG